MAAGSTYTPIATTTASGSVSSITFNSFSGYTDLILVMNTKTSSTSNLRLRFNSDTGTNYSGTQVFGFGSSTYSVRDTNQSFIYVGTTYDTWGNVILQLQQYASSSIYKTVLGRVNNAANQTSALVGLWRNTNAITSITIDNAQSFNFDSGSTFTLYGILAA